MFILDVLFCSIEEALDTLLRSLLKLFIVDANLADLAVGRNHGVELLTVLLHNFLQLFSTQVQRLRFVEIWMNQTDEFITGCHVFFLTRIPSPAIIAEAFSRIKPAVIIAVPLIIEKIIRKKVFPKIQNNRMRMLLHMPVINKKVREKICDQVTQAFGGNFYEIIIGGAAFNQEVENFLHSIGFRYTVGYGATECAPIICYEDYKHFVPGSCGKAARNMMVKIASPDPENVPGEILAKGPNVMLGYYKNEEATATTLDKEGWYHTGDLGTMDGDGNVFIKGRSKNMLLGASGQNIYPEEIEDKLNSLALVSESVVVQKGNKLIGLA